MRILRRHMKFRTMLACVFEGIVWCTRHSRIMYMESAGGHILYSFLCCPLTAEKIRPPHDILSCNPDVIVFLYNIDVILPLTQRFTLLWICTLLATELYLGINNIAGGLTPSPCFLPANYEPTRCGGYLSQRTITVQATVVKTKEITSNDFREDYDIPVPHGNHCQTLSHSRFDNINIIKNTYISFCIRAAKTTINITLTKPSRNKEYWSLSVVGPRHRALC